MRKPSIRLSEIKGADQLISVDLCFPDRTLPLLTKSKTQHLAIFSACTAQFVPDRFGNQIVVFLITRLINILGFSCGKKSYLPAKYVKLSDREKRKDDFAPILVLNSFLWPSTASGKLVWRVSRQNEFLITDL